MNFDIMAFMPIVLIFIVFYFLLLRPQQKKMKDHQTLIANLRRGDRVITSGGIIGTINKVVSETEVLIEIDDNVKVRVMKPMITEVLNKPEPIVDSAAAAPKKVANTSKKAPKEKTSEE